MKKSLPTYLLVSLISATSVVFFPAAHKSENQQPPRNKIFIINPYIRNEVNESMAGMDEIKSVEDVMLENKEEKRRKSSTVTIISTVDSLDHLTIHNKLRCLATLRNDSLFLENGINNYFSGINALIVLHQGRPEIYIQSFKEMVGEVDRTKVLAKVEKQIITLGKAKYAVGDSIHGHVYARISELNNLRYYVKGYFRAKVMANK